MAKKVSTLAVLDGAETPTRVIAAALAETVMLLPTWRYVWRDGESASFQGERS